MQTLDPNTVNWDQMVTVMRAVGDYMRYPVICILVVLAFVLYNSNVTLKYRKTYDMKSLRAQEQFNWPAIMPIVKEDLVSQDVNKGPWAMALTPMEFARKYNLLRKDDALLDNPVPGEEMTAGFGVAMPNEYLPCNWVLIGMVLNVALLRLTHCLPYL